MTQNSRQPAPFYDVVIVGGGVVGSLVAYRLSQYNISICLLDKEADLATGATGANSAIVHAGYDPKPGSMKAKYNVEGNLLFQTLCDTLGVPFIRNGSLVLAFNEQEHSQLAGLLQNGRINGVPGLEMLRAEQVRNLEPSVSGEVYSALLAPTGGIVCPYELTFAAAEVAYDNGAGFLFEHEVTRISRDDKDGRFTLTCATSKGHGPIIQIEAGLVVNAAGVYSDKVSAMAGDRSFAITPRRGEYSIVDKQIGRHVRHTIFQAPTEKGKGILVTPAVDENIIVGPNARFIDDPSDTSTTAEGIEEIWANALRSVPSLDRSYSIRAFSGIRATSSTHDFIVGESAAVPGLFQAAGIESPGLTAAPAIAAVLEESVVGTIRRSGKAITVKPGITMNRKAPVKFRSLELDAQNELLASNPLYANVVCRCENVTEPEVIDAIRRTIGEVTVNGIKMRTRSGMGRCQGGFCLPRILAIVARETGMDETDITLSGTGSEILTGRTRVISRVDG
ncbi:MAG: FAD-dependent oxidoreductase [Saccharofermentanales bacterium]